MNGDVNWEMFSFWLVIGCAVRVVELRGWRIRSVGGGTVELNFIRRCCNKIK